MSCSIQYKRFGNEVFRLREYSLIQELIHSTKNTIISIGGGTLTYEPNALALKNLGKIIYLECDFNELYNRLHLSGRHPTYLDPNNEKESFLALVESRKKTYEKYADVTIDVTHLSPDETARNITLLSDI